jgi:hypothetical protein
MSSATERLGQTGDERLSKITPDYAAWASPNVAARPWFREVFSFFGRRPTIDLIVLGSFACPTYLGVKVVEAADRIPSAGPIVLGIALAVTGFGTVAFLKNHDHGQSCNEGADAPPNA